MSVTRKIFNSTAARSCFLYTVYVKIKIRKRHDTGGCTTTNGGIPTVPGYEVQVTLIMSSNHQRVSNLITLAGNFGSFHTQEEEKEEEEEEEEEEEDVECGLRKT